MHGEMQQLRDKLSIAERTARSEAQLKEKYQLRLKVLEEGLKMTSSGNNRSTEGRSVSTGRSRRQSIGGVESISRPNSNGFLTKKTPISQPRPSVTNFLCVGMFTKIDRIHLLFWIQPAKDLIEEIAFLELEVIHLEQYLLSLYRKAFKQKISCVSCHSKDGKFESPPVTQKSTCPQINGLDNSLKRDHSMIHSGKLQNPQDLLANPRREISASIVNEMLLDTGIHRSHSSLSQHSAYEIQKSSPVENLAKGVWSFHSQPLSSLKYEPSATLSMISLAEYLGTCVAGHVPEAPNNISKDMIKCMSAIYCKVSDPPLIHHGLSSSPISSLSSESVFFSTRSVRYMEPLPQEGFFF